MPTLVKHPWPMKKDKLITINVLGTDYDIYQNSKKEDPALETMDGYCAYERKYIVIDKDTSELHKQHVIKHEIVHATLYESGLDVSSGWAVNEEIVDWIAHQMFKFANNSVDALKAIHQFEKEQYAKEKNKNGYNRKEKIPNA